jgi:Flp pilus assembly protein TadG
MNNRVPSLFTTGAGLLQRFRADQSGNYLVMMALLMPVLVGFVGFGTDYALWIYTHQTAQAAAESAAVSAATAANNFTVEAQAVTATYGFVDGSNGVTVTVNQPPQSGGHTTTSGAVEVIVQRTQTPIFSAAVWSSRQVSVSGRAVAVGGGAGCVLTLDKTASGALTVQGSAQVALAGCNLNDNSSSGTALSIGGSGSLSALGVGIVGNLSGSSNITATNGIMTGVAATKDPYASASFPSFSGCDQTNLTVKTDTSISHGVYCGGISINAGATLTLGPGIYYLDQGGLSMAGNSTITGTGVTLVFTSSTGNNWATADIGGNAVVNLTAPTSGPTAGIVLFGDRNMDAGTTFKLGGGGSQTFGGAVYLPKAALTYSGGASTSNGCTQIIADSVTFTGNSNLAINCSGYGTKFIGSVAASLVE